MVAPTRRSCHNWKSPEILLPFRCVYFFLLVIPRAGENLGFAFSFYFAPIPWQENCRTRFTASSEPPQAPGAAQARGDSKAKVSSSRTTFGSPTFNSLVLLATWFCLGDAPPVTLPKNTASFRSSVLASLSFYFCLVALRVDTRKTEPGFVRKLQSSKYVCLQHQMPEMVFLACSTGQFPGV